MAISLKALNRKSYKMNTSPLVISMYMYVLMTSFCANGLVDLPKTSYSKSGDIDLGYLVMLYDSANSDELCGQQVASTYRLRLVEAIVYAVEEINKNQELLPNVTLGYWIHDDCSRDLTSLARSLQFTQASTCYKDGDVTLKSTDTCRNIVGVVGPTTSRQSVMVASLFSLFEMPSVATYASADELSDDSRYKYFLSLTPPDRFASEGYVEMLAFFEWSYVSIIYSEGVYGESNVKQLHQAIKNSPMTICVATEERIPSQANQEDFDYIIQHLSKAQNATAVFLFVESGDGENLMKAVVAADLDIKFQWIGSLLSFAEDSDYSEILDGGISFGFDNEEMDPGYEAYFQSLSPESNPQNPWMKAMWETIYDCSWLSTTMDSSIKSCEEFSNFTVSDTNRYTYSYGWESRYLDATLLFAKALDLHIKQNCPEAFEDKALLKHCISGPELFKALTNTSFHGLMGPIQFDEKGNFLGSYTIKQFTNEPNPHFDIVGTWETKNNELDIHVEKLRWSGRDMTEEKIPMSVCSTECGPKQYSIPQDSPCCWSCRTCRESEIIINETDCEMCPEFTWPDDNNATYCIDIEPYFLQWSDSMAIIITIVNVISFVFGASICIFVFIYKENKLIKASSRELSTIILIGIMSAFFVVFFIVDKPSIASCAITRIGFPTTVTLIYAPMFIKTNRVYRIFTNAKKTTAKPILIGRHAQVVMTFILICLQIILSSVFLVLDPPVTELRMPIPTNKYVEVFCSWSLTALMVTLSFNILLLIICLAYAFLTRKLPENYNESWYVFICVATTIILWIAFLPTYYATFYAFHRDILLSLCLILNGDMTLLCLFAPKMYAILFVEESRITFGPGGTISGATTTSTVHPK